MTHEFLKHNWSELRAMIQAHWQALTDSDLDLINGDEYVLIGNLQALYGRSKEEAEQRYCEFLESLRGLPAVH